MGGCSGGSDRERAGLDGCITFNNNNAMTKEELKTQVSALVDAAWKYGHAEGANEAAEAHAKELAEMKKEVQDAYDTGYKDGHKAALDNAGLTQPTEDEVEPQPEVVPEYSLENSAVEGFMLDQTYYAPGFAIGTGLTVVNEYYKGAVEGSKQSWTEQPALVPEECSAIAGEPIFEGIYNLVPGKEYSYLKQEDGDVVVGKFRTKANTVRMIRMADADPVVNIRDLGGYKCEGGHVAYNKVIRSATLARLTKDSTNTKILAALGITDEITFSSSNPARTDLGLWKGAYYGIDAYTSVLTKTTQWSKIKSVFVRILNDVKSGGCALMHCFAGTDRSGTIAALLLGVLGVCEGDIIKDWEMTSMCCWFNRVRISDWETREVVRQECPEGQLRQFFQKMKATYGKNGETFQKQCEAYLKKCGFTAAQIAELKMYMIVPSATE